MDNETIAACISENFPDKNFRLVRHTYILEDPNKSILIGFAEEPNFPTQTFSKQWEVFSESYYYCDLFNEPILEMASECIANDTGLKIPFSDITIFQLGAFEHPLAYYETQFPAQPAYQESKYSLESFLNIYYRVKVHHRDTFNFWSDNYIDERWVNIREALEIVTVEMDRDCLGKLLTHLG